MLVDHCVSLLTTGSSNFRNSQFTSDEQVVFKLESGISYKKLSAMNTALMMLEFIKLSVSAHHCNDEADHFNNFVNYVFDNMSEPLAMAFIKYAISNRKIVIKNIYKQPSWNKISQAFKPAMLENSKTPKDLKVYNRFNKFYTLLQGKTATSNAISEYLQTNSSITFSAC